MQPRLGILDIAKDLRPPFPQTFVVEVDFDETIEPLSRSGPREPAILLALENIFSTRRKSSSPKVHTHMLMLERGKALSLGRP